MTFSEWLDAFVEEKELDTEHGFEVNGPQWGWNLIPLGCVIEALKQAPTNQQEAARRKLIALDFINADVMDFFKHLAGAMAL